MGTKNFAASTQSYVLLHGVEERENDILIPLDKHSPCEQMRRADGFFGLWPITLGERRKGRSTRNVTTGSPNPAGIMHLPARVSQGIRR